MAAGQGFKTFTSGEVLTAADVNGYLMQGVGVFTDAANRDAEITSPQEGQFAYLKDTNVTTYYTGSAWVGIGASPLTTKGDVYTYSTTDARLAVGANNTVLTADSAEATGLKWATPASGGMTLLSTTTLSGTSTTISSISQSYNALLVWIVSVTSGSAYTLQVNPNSTSGTSPNCGTQVTGGSTTLNKADDIRPFGGDQTTTYTENACAIWIHNYASTSQRKPINFFGDNNGGSSKNMGGIFRSSSAVTSIQVTTQAGTASFTGGTVYIYGVK